MPSQNTLELAKQGDPIAISTILTYHLTQRYNIEASVIRLGDYLSVLVEAEFPPDQAATVTLIYHTICDLSIEALATIEISGRRVGDREVRWNQTLELDYSTHDRPSIMNPDSFTSEMTGTSSLPECQTPDVRQEIASLPHADLPSAPPDAPPQDQDPWVPLLEKLVRRPEMLAIVAFALAAVLWEAYAEWISDIDAAPSLSGTKLARRLGVHSSTLNRYRTRPNFPDWSRDLDPDGIAWSYDGQVFVMKIGA